MTLQSPTSRDHEPVPSMPYRTLGIALLVILLVGGGSMLRVVPASAAAPRLGGNWAGDGAVASAMSAHVMAPWHPSEGRSSPGAPPVRLATTNLQTPSGSAQPSGTPTWLAYDPNDAAFWVAVDPSSVDVILANSTWLVQRVLPVGLAPFGVAVDAARDLVFVTNSGSNNVTVLNDSTLTTVASVPVGSVPLGVAYDAVHDRVYVANSGSSNVTVIDPQTRSSVANVSVGWTPTGVAVDPATDRVFVANRGSGSVSAISGATDLVVATIPAGLGPYGVAVDPKTDEVWVSNNDSENLTVINATRGQVVDSIPVAIPGWSVTPQGIAYDAQTDQMWVGSGYWYLIVLNATPHQVAAYITTDPSGVAYDSASGTVCATNTNNATFACLSGPKSWPASLSTVTVRESGLPSGTEWGVTVDNLSGRSSNASQQDLYLSTVGIFGESYQLAFAAAGGWVATPGSVNLGASQLHPRVQLNVSFTPAGSTHAVDFVESGLPKGVVWSVALAGVAVESGGTTIRFNEANGTYAFTVPTVGRATPTPASGNVTVAGQAVQVSIAFPSSGHSVVFTESGLPPGDGWAVNVTSAPPGFPGPNSTWSNAGALTLDLIDGAYQVTVASADRWYAANSPVAFNVTGGVVSPSAATSVVFHRHVTPVTFTEVGLQAGTSWSVVLGGTTVATVTASVTFDEPSGAYNFSIASPPGYVGSPASGVVSVTYGVPVSVAVGFHSTFLYNVTFSESGLPNGTGWAVAVGSDFGSSTGATITLREANGTYQYVVLGASGYHPVAPAPFTVGGASVTVPVRFTANTFPVVIIEVGLPAGTNWSATVTNSSTGLSETLATNGSALIFFLPNGTYALSISVPRGFSANVSSATFTVAGNLARTPTVGFTPNPAGAGSAPAANPLTSPVVPWLLVAILGAVVVALLALRFRRGPPGTPVPSPAAALH